MRANLLSLQQTASMMEQTQNRLSTGKKVNSALDNPATYFTARAHTDRSNLLAGLKDNISEAIQLVKAADSGVKGITTLIENLRGQLSTARSALNSSTSSTLLAGVASGYNELVNQLNNTAKDSAYGGVNFLSASSGSKSTLTVNFNEEATTKLAMSGFDASASGLAISSGTYTGAASTTSATFSTATNISSIETSLNNALATLRVESGKLANNLAMLTTRQTFITDISNTLMTGATNLTAADTNEEGANMLMLQTRQSLGTTSLSLASQSAQSVLRLF
jgi:flagellin-like hook-associated protein FlgL